MNHDSCDQQQGYVVFMRKVHLICSFLLAFSALTFGLGCGGAKPGDAAKASTASELSLQWLPADTELVLHVKVAALWKAPLLNGLVQSPQTTDFVKQMKEKTGLTPEDIESVTVGAQDLKGLQASGMNQMLGLAPSTDVPKSTMILRTKKSVVLGDLLKSSDNLKEAEYKSKKYFETIKGQTIGGWVAEPTIVIVAPIEELKAAMDRGAVTGTPRKELTFMDTSSHVLLIAAPKDPKFLSQGINAAPPGSPPALVEMQKVMADSIPALGISFNVRGGIDLQTSLMLASSDGAGKVKTGFDAALTDARQQFESFKVLVPKDLAEVGQMLLDNSKVDTQAAVVTFSTNVPESAQATLEKVPATLMSMLGMQMGNPFGGDAAEPEIKPTPKAAPRRRTGSKPKPSGAGSTTGGGIEVPGGSPKGDPK